MHAWKAFSKAKQKPNAVHADFFILWDTFYDQKYDHYPLVILQNQNLVSKGSVSVGLFLLLIVIVSPPWQGWLFYNQLVFWTNQTLNLKEGLVCDVFLYRNCSISAVCTVQSRTNFTEMQFFPAVNAFLFDSAIFLSTSSFPVQSLYLGTETSKSHFIKCIYFLRWSLQ